MVFKFAYCVKLNIAYQPSKFQYYRLSGSSFTEGLKEHNDDVIVMSFHMFLGFEICIFCEACYKISICQVSNLLVIWIKFYRGWYSRQKHHYDVIMTSFLQYWVFEIAHSVEHNTSYQPAKVHWPRLAGSNFTGTEAPPLRLTCS